MSDKRCIKTVRNLYLPEGERCGNSATRGDYCHVHDPELIQRCPLCGSEGLPGKGYAEDEFVTCADKTKKCVWYNWIIPFKAWQALPRTRKRRKK